MHFLGVDIGSSATKAVAVDQQGIILAKSVVQMGTGTYGLSSALEALYGQGVICEQDCKNVVATGYGRMNFNKASMQISEISCHAKGVRALLPTVHTIIDIGGQDSKAISLNDNGHIQQFAMNDKCAAGTGRFLEMICRVLGISISNMGILSQNANEVLPISNTCAVFAESEIISRLSEGCAIPDILAGIHSSIAKRVSGLVMRIGLVENVALTGGVATNIGIVEALGKELHTKILIPPEPQITGALGAALYAMENYT